MNSEKQISKALKDHIMQNQNINNNIPINTYNKLLNMN